MAHGGYSKRRMAGRPSVARRSGSMAGGGGRGRGRVTGVRKDPEKKTKIVSIKNQIRSIERLLKKALSVEMKDAQQKKLEELKKQADLHARCELERKMALRYRRVKFFERRKIERRIRRLEKLQRASADNARPDGDSKAEITQELAQLREDLEYVRFFPKTEKYVSLFTGDDEQVVARRNELREKIKANRVAAAAAGVDLEETGSEDDGAMDISEDDFFLAGTSSDEADADDEWTDRSARMGDDKDDTSRECLPSSPIREDVAIRQVIPNKRGREFEPSRKASRHPPKDQKQKSASALMPPPRSRGSQISSSSGGGSKSGHRHSSSGDTDRRKNYRSSANTEDVTARGKQRSTSSNSWEVVEGGRSRSATAGSSASDVQQKPKRKRTRPKKKRKQQDTS